jgi:hypothetical protein
MVMNPGLAPEAGEYAWHPHACAALYLAHYYEDGSG